MGVIRKSYECVICFQSFKKQILVNKHLKLHLQSYIYDGSKNENASDPISENQLKNINTPEKKLESIHENKDDKNFKISTDLNRKTHVCEICEKSFRRKDHYQKHKAVHEVKCDICDYSFSQKDNLQRHLASVHEKQKPFNCDNCDYSFSEKGSLKKHLESVHEKKKPFKCDTCDTIFTRQTSLKRHILKNHITEKKLENIHAKTDINMIRKTHVCEICDKVFRRKNHYQKHKAVHEGKKPFQCEICSKRFPTKFKLNLHIASVHEGKKSFTCTECGKNFSRKDKLKDHKTKVHEGKKPFKCQVCDIGFAKKKSLNRHLETIHEGKESKETSDSEDQFQIKHNNTPDCPEKLGSKAIVNYSNFVCEFCGFEPKTKNKRQDKEDHIIRVHFRDELDKIFPKENSYSPGPSSIYSWFIKPLSCLHSGSKFKNFYFNLKSIFFSYFLVRVLDLKKKLLKVFFCTQKVEKKTPLKVAKKNSIIFLHYCLELPNRPKYQNSSSKMWLIDQLYVKLGSRYLSI